MPFDEGDEEACTVASYAEYAPALFRMNRRCTPPHSAPRPTSLVAPFAKDTQCLLYAGIFVSGMKILIGNVFGIRSEAFLLLLVIVKPDTQ